MDYEKKYRNALSWMRSVYPMLNGMAKEDAEHFFPELAESDDKRIWEAIVREFERASNSYLIETYDLSKDKFLAYLEKQKESLHVPDTYKENADSFTNEDERIRKEIVDLVKRHVLPEDKQLVPGGHTTMEEAITYLEKQKDSNDMAFHEGYTLGFEDGMKEKEQKPISSYDIVPYIDDKIAELQDMWREEKVAFDWDDMKDMIEDVARHFYHKEQKPAEWSYPYGENETVDKLIAIAECLEMDGDCLFNGYSGTECGKFLRELARKQVECKPSEWSDEDDQLIGFIFDLLNSLVWRKEWAMDKKECLERLKSLRPSWKPSEWQMSMLLAVINDPNNAGSESCYLTLKSIYEQLKKL